MRHPIRCAVLLTGFFVLLSCSSGTPAISSSPSVQAPGPENVEATIIGLERRWANAIVNRDLATLNELISDDFTGTSWGGETYSKAKAVKDIEFKVYVAESVDLEGIKVNVFGDTAVATFSQIEKSKYDNKDCSGRYGYTDVWLKKNGSWQAVSSYGRIE